MDILNNIPAKGFYRHYKHDPKGGPFNYMYEVVGIGRNTEDDTYAVLYRPLYKSDWMPPADYQSRPFEMFIENVEKEGISMSRFTLITDPNLISQLEDERTQLYR
jgi:hypothetical protein